MRINETPVLPSGVSETDGIISGTFDAPGDGLLFINLIYTYQGYSNAPSVTVNNVTVAHFQFDRGCTHNCVPISKTNTIGIVNFYPNDSSFVGNIIYVPFKTIL